MKTMLIRRFAALCALLLSFVIFVAPSHGDEVLFTYGEMSRLQMLPLESAERGVSQEELDLYQNFEFYAYTVFESLQAANDAAVLINQEPLFCAPSSAFRFRKEGDIARLADYVTTELIALTKQIGGALDRYDDRPASQVLLLGLRAAFPCDRGSQLALR